MDTKSRKSKPGLVWLCFFIGLSIVLSLAAFGISEYGSIRDNVGDIMAALRSDVKDTRNFKEDMATRFKKLVVSSEGVDPFIDNPYYGFYASYFVNEGANLIYFAENLKTGKIFTNTTADKIYPNGKVVLPKGYDYYLYYDGQGFSGMKDGKAIDFYAEKSGYRGTDLEVYIRNKIVKSDLRIILIVKENLVRNPQGEFSYLYQIKSDMVQTKWLNIGCAASFFTGMALLVFAWFQRKTKREFDKRIVRISGAVWFEFKIILTVLALVYILLGGYRPGAMYYSYSSVYGAIYISFNTKIIAQAIGILLGCFWWFYFIISDVIVNKRNFYRNNSVNWLIERYRKFEEGKPFQKAMLWRIYSMIAAEALLFAAILISASLTNGIFIAPLFAVAGIYLAYRFLRHYRGFARDIGTLLDQIKSLRNGDAVSVPALASDSDFHSAGEDLCRVQEGLMLIAEQKIKSERMKVELVTNVSHDLKTPLTSIVSYVDLLAREDGLPEHVREYVRILSHKSDRLKTLIQDLFDLSKASSGAMEIETERLDLGKLIRQTLADMEEPISASGLIFKVNIPDAPVAVRSDGKKLYRVFQNLVSNALKYSPAGSRVYVELKPDDAGRVMVEIKNVSNYEMNFDPEEITERFARGDKARSTEGSGLGLAIAQSFTEACGGSFGIQIDGDLFKVTLGFDLSPAIAA